MFKSLLARARRIALETAASEINRILTKAKATNGVDAEAGEEAVILKGRKLKRRAVADPAVRDIAR